MSHSAGHLAPPPTFSPLASFSNVTSSWRIGKAFNVPVDLHWSCIVVPPLILFFAYRPGYGIDWGQASWYAGITIILFLFVLLHELGHALMARNRGVVAERIVLFPLGGGAFIPEQPKRVRDEVLVFAAGPGVNLLIAALALPLLLALPNGRYLLQYYLNPQSNLIVIPRFPEVLLTTTVAVNAVLAVGNLLPAYPLDGGRIVRALLRGPLGARRATVVVTVIGIVTGAALIWLSYRLGDPLLAIGAAFVAILSSMEYRNGWQRRRLDARTVTEVMRPLPRRRLYRNSRVGEARRAFTVTSAPVLPVYDRWNQLSGFVSREVIDAEAGGDEESLLPYYEAEFVGCHPAENLLRVTERIVDADVYGAAVFGSRRRIVGFVYTEDVIKLLDNWPRKLGESVSEIAARSRSQHKSQGFGSAGRRGENIEQLELLEGDDNDREGDPFAGIDLSWGRVPGGAMIEDRVNQILRNYDYGDPAASVPALLELHAAIRSLDDPGAAYWREKKGGEVKEIIGHALGLYIGARADEAFVTPGDSLTVDLEVANRSGMDVELFDVYFDVPGARIDVAETDQTLVAPGVSSQEFSIQIPEGTATSGPYWLQQAASLGMYRVDEQQLIGRGESEDPVSAVIGLRVGNTLLSFRRPVRQSYTDPVRGEQQQPLEILPPVFAELSESSYLFTTSAATEVQVKVTAGRAGLSGTVEVCTPEGWAVRPERTDFTLERKGEERYFSFQLTPPEGQAQGMIVPLVRLDGNEEGYTRKLVRIAHDHIPTQLADLDASAPVAKLDLRTAGEHIGYLPGAGDAIPQALTNIGYRVTTLDDAAITTGDLNRFDAIVVGIRAYNTLDRMPVYHPLLLEYVKEGGTLVVQYNTNRRLKVDQAELGPYPLKLSRDRVTVEEAPVRILAADHPVLNYPNKITEADFEGWVQERGLYFPNEWDEAYTPILSSNDPGEPARDGGLLVAEYGEGHFVYTGYSFFRELPAGVPGAYRLFANLIGLGNSSR